MASAQGRRGMHGRFSEFVPRLRAPAEKAFVEFR